MSQIDLLRRRFLKQTTGAGLLAAAQARAEALPEITIGNKRVSRLIAGSNPIAGYSYGTAKLTAHMQSYFTVERTTEFLLHCEGQGITTFQGHLSPKIRAALLAARERGSKIQFILLASGFESGVPKDALELQPIAIAHHGGVTDKLFRAGQYGVVHDFVKKVHDIGLVAGVSMHNPDNLARIEDSAWENDFYMTCFYHLTRSSEELGRIVSEPTVEQTLGEYYFFAGDPDRMTRRVREARKPCLGFKILGAGRLCKDAQMVDKAFSYAYRSIKPVDAVIVGMYPALSDEVQENVALARKHSRST